MSHIFGSKILMGCILLGVTFFTKIYIFGLINIENIFIFLSIANCDLTFTAALYLI